MTTLIPAFVLLGLGTLISLIASIILVVQAFRESVLWGLASLFIPVAVVVFAVKHWEDCRKPLLASLVGLVCVVGGGGLLALSASSVSADLEAASATAGHEYGQLADDDGLDDGDGLDAEEPEGQAPFVAASEEMAGVSEADGGDRSLPGEKEISVAFHNATSSTVDLVWVDGEGNENAHGTMGPGERYDQQTVENHLWRFRSGSRDLGSYRVRATDKSHTISDRM